MTRYVVEVSPDGQVRVTTHDVHGPACLESMDTIKKMTPGAEVLDSALTSDYYATNTSVDIQSEIEDHA